MNDAKQIEITLEAAKTKVAEGDAMRRLIDNADFKKVFTEGYFKEYAAGLVCQKALPQMQTDDIQRDIDNSIIGVGQVREYIRAVLAEANQAAQSIKGLDSEMELALEEEAGE